MSSHIDASNKANMVDVSSKNITRRTATAQAIVLVNQQVVAMFNDGEIKSKKGPVFHTAIIAATMAAKETSRLIPLCHPLPLELCAVDIKLIGHEVIITCQCVTTGKTGIEMEALTAASVGALTIYDMMKSVDASMVISQVKLLEKTGGKNDFSHA